MAAAVLPVVLQAVIAAGPTVEEALSAPFVSHLVAAAKAERIAWVVHDRGRREIWSAAGPDFKPQPLWRAPGDDGLELSGLRISADGTRLVFVRGGEADRQGPPNPRSAPHPTPQQLYALKIGAEARALGPGSEPALAPDGKALAWLENGRLHLGSSDGKEREVLELRGEAHSPVWSPGGGKIAFRSQRKDHSFIGVYDLTARKVTWLSPGVDRDRSPAWSPDGRQVAFIRLPGDRSDKDEHWVPRQTTVALWVADVESGEGRPVWTSPDKTDSFAAEYPYPPLAWARDRLLFFWEGGGWMRLFSVPVAGGEPTPLSPSSCEAEGVNLSPDRATAYFWANCGDLERRHLWSAPLEGGTPRQLTFGTRLEWWPVALASGKRLAFLQSSFAQPPVPTVLELAEGAKPRQLGLEALRRFPASQLVEPEVVSFKAKDGQEIRGLLLRPQTKGARGGAVIYVHGGPRRQMLSGWHYMEYYHYFYAMNQLLALRGYTVLEVNYRGGVGYGRLFRLAPGTGARGASEFQDLVAAAEFLRGRSEVNPARIAIWGGSYGGYLTALALARRSDLFVAGVDFAGVGNRLHTRDSERQDALAIEAQRIAVVSSPIADVERWRSPVLFVHGDDDRVASFSQAVDLVQRLRAAGNARVETLVLPDEGHGWLLHENMVKSFQAAARFLERELGEP